jgi:hypothetical protein
VRLWPTPSQQSTEPFQLVVEPLRPYTLDLNRIEVGGWRLHRHADGTITASPPTDDDPRHERRPDWTAIEARPDTVATSRLSQRLGFQPSHRHHDRVAPP